MIFLNLFIGYVGRGFIDNAAHLGGLVSGALIALVVDYRRPDERIGHRRSVARSSSRRDRTGGAWLFAGGATFPRSVTAGFDRGKPGFARDRRKRSEVRRVGPGHE